MKRKELEAVAGLYEIRNHAAGKSYFGSSDNLRRRCGAHRSLLRRGVHDNPHLQRAWDRDGEDAFEFRVLAVLEAADLIPVEQRLLDMVVGRKDCYNMAPLANAPIYGREVSAETRARMSAASKGRKMPPRSEEHLRRLSEARKVRVYKPLSEEHKAALVAGRRRTPMPESAKEAIRKAKLGKPSPWTAERNRKGLSEETRRKMSETKRGVPQTAEHREAISKAMRELPKHGKGRFAPGHQPSEETRAKLSAASRGRKLGTPSEETRLKMSVAKRGRPWSEARRLAHEAKRKDREGNS